MTIITNGDSAVGAISSIGIKADFIPWRDVLHDGPVPFCKSLKELSIIRAEFLSGVGWGEYNSNLSMFEERNRNFFNAIKTDEILLWFEHDLYDQLQLIQILYELHKAKNNISGSIKLICTDNFIAESSKDMLKECYNQKIDVTDQMLEVGSNAWLDFVSSDPRRLVQLLDKSNREFPFLKNAIKRLLQEYPDTKTGLSKSEFKILSLLNKSSFTPGKLFREYLQIDTPNYLGDLSFFQYLVQMSQYKEALIASSTGKSIKIKSHSNIQDFLETELILTRTGKETLNGTANNLKMNFINKWIGGVYLTKNNYWVWNDASNSLWKYN